MTWTDLMPQGHASLARSLIGLAAAWVDVLMILLAAVVAGVGDHRYAFVTNGPVGHFATMGLFIALIFVLGNAVRDEYSLVKYLNYSGHCSRPIALWTIAIVSAMAGAFLFRSSPDFSRATIIIIYPLGLALVASGRLVFVSLLRSRARDGRAPMRRAFLLGDEIEIETFSRLYQPWSSGLRIISATILRGAEFLEDDLALAAASARMLQPDDVFILVPWSEPKTITACVDAFLRIPAATHVGPQRVLDGFADAKISKIGTVSSLDLTSRPPLTPVGFVVKNLFDFVFGAAILLALLPAMALIALAIKIDSPGPVFFLQRRYGFNQRPFRIVKFRSMRTLDDGRSIAQAVKGDPRITRVGAFLRRYNLDELPQLFNVLAGHMSLIGPRPHAVPHDQKFGASIALYARRHNVKPGMTGWAQVNGFRGETATDDAMRKRIEHDLWYIDNWSFPLDLRILCLTVFSAKAYRNAR